MPYDALGNYFPGDDVPFDAGAGSAGPLGNLNNAPALKREGRIAGDSVLDIPPNAVSGTHSLDTSFKALAQYVMQRDGLNSDMPKRSFMENMQDVAAREAAKENDGTLAATHTQWLEKLADGWRNKTDQLTGAPPEEERSTGEKVLGAIIPALIPGGEIAALNDAGKVGKGVNAVLGKTKIPGADLIDPRTQNFTPGGVALNAAIGGVGTAALDAGVNEAPVHVAEEHPEQAVTTYNNDHDTTGQPIGIVDATPVDERPIEKQTRDSIFTTVTTAALPFAALFGMSHGQSGKLGKTLGELSVHAGPGHVEAPKVGPSDAAYALDEMSALEHPIAQASGDPAKGKAWGDLATQNTRGNVGAKVEKAVVTGQLDGLNWTIPPIAEIDARLARDAQVHGPDFPAYVDKGMIYRSEYADRLGRMDTLTRDIQNADMQIQAKRAYAMSLTDPKQQNLVFKNISEVQTTKAKKEVELDRYKLDTPETRPGLVDVSNNDLGKFVKEFENDPRTEEYIRINKEQNVGIIDYAHANGVIDKETRDFLFDNKVDNHVFLKNDPYIGADGKPLTGFDRMKAQAWQAIRSSTDDVFSMDKEARGPAYKPLLSRDPAEVLSDRVNNPINFRDAKHAEIERMVRFVSRQKLARDWADTVLSGPKWHEVVDQKMGPGNNPLWSPESLHHGLKEGFVNREKDIIIPRGDKYQVLRPKDERVKATLDQRPLSQIPFFSGITRIFTQNTTGAFRPFFAPIRIAYDAGTFSLNRRLHEPHGIEGLYEQARRGVRAATGADLPASPQWANMVARFGGPVTTISDAGAIQASAFIGSMESFYRQNQKQMALALMQDMSQRAPIIATLARVAPQVAHNLGNTMLNAYKESLYATAVDLNVLHPAELRHVSATKRNYDKFLGTLGPRIANNVFGQTLHSAVLGYRMALNSVEGGLQLSAFTSYANREMMAAGVKTFDQLPKATQERIARYARVTGGDFSRAPGQSKGGKAIQQLNSVAPWTNVMARTTQSIWRSMADHPATFGAALTSGVVVPYIMGEWILSNWDDGAHKFRFEDTPTWERIQNIPIITLPGFIAWHQGKPFDRSYVHHSLLIPETRAMGFTVSESLRALGLYGKRSAGPINDPSAVTALEGLAAGLKDAFAIIAPPALTALAARSGVKIDLGNFYNLLPDVADQIKNGPAAQTRPGMFDATQAINNSRAGDAMPYNPTSNISKNTADLVSGILGGTANTALTMFDSYDQAREQSDGVAVAAMKAGKEGLQQEVEYAKKQIVRGTGIDFFGLGNRIYRATPTADYVRDAKKTYDMVAGRNASIKPNVLVDGGGLLDNIANTLRWDGAHDSELKDLRKQWFELNDQTKALKANNKLPASEKTALEKQLLLEMQQVTHQQADIIQRTEKQMIEDYGAEFKKRFGHDLSFASARAYMTKAGNAARYRPSEAQ